MWLRSPQTNAQARAGDLQRASCHIDDLGDLLAAFAAFDQILDLLDALRRELDRSSVGFIRNLDDGHSRTHTGAALRLVAPTVLGRFAPCGKLTRELGRGSASTDGCDPYACEVSSRCRGPTILYRFVSFVSPRGAPTAKPAASHADRAWREWAAFRCTVPG